MLKATTAKTIDAFSRLRQAGFPIVQRFFVFVFFFYPCSVVTQPQPRQHVSLGNLCSLRQPDPHSRKKMLTLPFLSTVALPMQLRTFLTGISKNHFSDSGKPVARG